MKVGYNVLVWRSFHRLTAMNVFIVASLSASFFAALVAFGSVSRDATNLMRDLLWPHQLNPYRFRRYFPFYCSGLSWLLPFGSSRCGVESSMLLCDIVCGHLRGILCFPASQCPIRCSRLRDDLFTHLRSAVLVQPQDG